MDAERESHENDSEITTDSPLNAEEKGVTVGTRQASARTTGKKKRTSKSASLQAEYDIKLRSLEDNFNQKFDQIFQLFQNRAGNVDCNRDNQNRDFTEMPI